MPSPITSATQTQPAVAVQPAPVPSKSNQSKAQPSKAADTVQISAAAQAQLNAIKELKETQSQTAQEANRGDHQAQRLLAKENAAENVNS